MRNKNFETNVINLKKRKRKKKYKALYYLLTRIKIIFKNKFSKPDTVKKYKKTINH